MFLFYDTEMILTWARGLWAGQYNGVYPLPATAIFSVLSLMPYEVVGAVTAVASLVILVMIFKRRALAWALYIPTLHCIYLGQMEIIIFGLLRLGTPLALAAMSLKPHMLLFALPRLFEFSHKERLRFALYTSALYLPAFILRPGWVGEWVSNINAIDRINEQAVTATLWGTPALMLMLALPALLTIRLDTLSHLLPAIILTVFKPVRVYDMIFLADHDSIWLVPVSWGMTLAGLLISVVTGFAIWPASIMAVVTLIYIVWYNRRVPKPKTDAILPENRAILGT